MEAPRYLWRQLNSREHMIFSKRRTGNEKDEKSRVREKKTEMVARGRVMHTSNACTRERAGAPRFTVVNLSPFILYEAIRCFTRNGIRFESLSVLFPALSRKQISFLSLSIYDFVFFPERNEKGLYGKEINNFGEGEIVVLERVIRRQ